MLSNAAYNLTNALRMKQHNACVHVGNLHVEITGVSICLLFAILCQLSFSYDIVPTIVNCQLKNVTEKTYKAYTISFYATGGRSVLFP